MDVIRLVVFALILVLTHDVAADELRSGDIHTEAQWQQMYDTCLQAGRMAEEKLKLGPNYGPVWCGCVRDQMKKTPEQERDTAFNEINRQCSQKALGPIQAEVYPVAAVANPHVTCRQRQDIKPENMDAYCACYVDLVQKNISWREFQILDAAIQTKGTAGLDLIEKVILKKGLEDSYYCAMKTENPSLSPVAPKSSAFFPVQNSTASSDHPVQDFLTVVMYGLGYTLFMPLILPTAWPYLHPGVRAIWVLLVAGWTWMDYVGEKAQGHVRYPALLVWVLGPLIVISVRALDRWFFPKAV